MLIIYAHPDTEWNCSYILEKLEKELNKKDEKYKILDLYKENFNPVLSKDELYTHWWKEVDEQTKKYQDLLKKEKKIVIIYPTWWNSTPAILKGFFDKVLTAWFAFKFKWAMPVWLLKWRVAVITTTWWPAFFQILFAKTRSLKTVVKDTIKFCWFKSRWFLVWSANHLTDKTKANIDKKIMKVLSYLG